MKNYEKYADEIRGYNSIDICSEFIKPHILEADSCNGVDCRSCATLQMLWLLEDYEEPEINWNKVEVDTPILVRATKNEEWSKRYFAKYENGYVHAWIGGCTSWSEENASAWKYAKLAESEEE